MVKLMEDFFTAMVLQYRITQGTTQAIQYRRTKQKGLNVGRLLTQYFLHEVVLYELVAACEGGNKRFGVLVHAKRLGGQFQA
ncbi:hypothetical protein, partial [Rhodoferax ferrireducens]|uniref:hypothetical protein n=1 Tax=Rhodoferax ferrireducens TaxID=192843 RepID=UPI0013006544